MKEPVISLFHFNPTCELAVANGSPYYMAPALLREFEEELTPLMLLFSSGSDWILQENPVAETFVRELTRLGFPSAEFLTKDEILSRINTLNINYIKLKPWGISPAESYLFDFIQPFTKQKWQPKMKDLYGRKMSSQFLHDFIQKHRQSIFPGVDELPQLVTAIPEIERLIDRLGNVVVKSPFSSSGRGLQVIRRQKLNAANIQWINTNLKQQGYLVVEKWHNKLHDLSFQFYIGENGKVDYLGPSFFLTNSNGQYVGHHLNFSAYGQLPFSSLQINDIGHKLTDALVCSDYAKIHRGYLGIDALIYEEKNAVKFHPCLEINARYTMGTVCKMIEKYLHPEASGYFRTFFSTKSSYLEFAQQQAGKFPPEIIEGKLKYGFVSLTAPSSLSRFGAYIELDPNKTNSANT